MLGTSAFLERIFPALPELESFATALEASRAEAASRLVDGIRHLSALVEVSETVTQSFSLDHQLPRLIELITELLDVGDVCPAGFQVLRDYQLVLMQEYAVI
jgi:hypothetical protein